MIPYLGLAAAPPVDFVKVTEYVPVTFTFAPTFGIGFGRAMPQNSSWSLTSFSLPSAALSMASIMLNSWALFEAQPMTSIMSLVSFFSSAIANVGTGALQSAGSPLPVLWIEQAGASL